MFQLNPQTLYPVVVQEATELEGKVIDGWFFQSDSRSLKSGYRDCPSAEKAQFACDYMQILTDKHEDLLKDFKSYVPYSAREKFARAWWTDPKHSTTFVKEPYYKQIIWLHEALMDGGELWWRALEKQCPDGVPSSGALGHDQEQLMVSKYKEDESSPEKSFSSFSPKDVPPADAKSTVGESAAVPVTAANGAAKPAADARGAAAASHTTNSTTEIVPAPGLAVKK
jgi:hypothetical protein